MRHATANRTARVDLRTWPLDPSIAHLVLLDVNMVPTADEVDVWVRNAFEPTATNDETTTATPVNSIRTGALFAAAADVFLDRGFVEVDRLALLERALLDPIRATTPPGLSTTRLRRRDLTVAAEIDRAAFPDGWRHDAASLDGIASATPQARRRLITSEFGHTRPAAPVGFALTGRAGPNGYIQRLAVHPEARRNGAARALIDDALAWLVRRGAQRALVNTGVDNGAALDLYRGAGFDRLADELVVVELARTS